jgi:hypothetical protein
VPPPASRTISAEDRMTPKISWHYHRAG